MSADPEERENELLALQSIFTSEEFVRGQSQPAGEIRVSAELPERFAVSIEEGMRRHYFFYLIILSYFFFNFYFFLTLWHVTFEQNRVSMK